MRARFLTLILVPTVMVAAAACGWTDGPDSPPDPTPDRSGTAAPTTIEVPAPIEALTLRVAESYPPQYFLEITFGLPNACHTFDRTETRRSGIAITVSVINRAVTGDVACAEIYKTETHSVALGKDFEPGATYTVQVNEETLTFTAQ